MLKALNREILWKEFWEWKLYNVKITLMLMTWHHGSRYRYDITLTLYHWIIETIIKKILQIKNMTHKMQLRIPSRAQHFDDVHTQEL